MESLVWTIYDDSGIQTKPCITLYIIMSLWLFRRSFRGSHPNDVTIAVTHPGVLSLQLLLTKHAARRWFIWSEVYGSQAADAYSKVGLTMVV